jgi:hypothetical protein
MFLDYVTIAQRVKELPGFYGVWRFISLLTRVRLTTGLCPEPHKYSSHPHVLCLSYPILYYSPMWLFLSSFLFPSDYLLKTLCEFFIFCPPPLLLDLITLIIFGEEFKLWSFSLYGFLRGLITSPLSGPNILPYTLFSSTLNHYARCNVRDRSTDSRLP